MQFFIKNKAQIVFGANCIFALPDQMLQRGLKSVLIVIDPVFVENGTLAKLEAILDEKGIAHCAYSNIQADAPDFAVMEAAELARKENVDTVYGLGGGGAMDTAKAVNVLTTNDAPLITFADPRAPRNPGKFLVLTPTTAGTGAEIVGGAVIHFTDMHRKLPVAGGGTSSDLALVDPMLSVSLPKGLTASTGVDAFTHAAGCITAGFNDNPISEVLAIDAIKLVMEYLPKVLEDPGDLEAREKMQFAALIAGMAFADKPPHIDHCIGHTMGSLAGTAHGVAVGSTMPLSIKYVAEVVPEKVAIVADAMGVDIAGLDAKAAGDKVADAIEDFVRSVGLPSFKELGFDDEMLQQIAKVTPTDVTAFCCPRIITEDDVLALLREANK